MTLQEIIARLAQIDGEVRAATDATIVDQLAAEKAELLTRKAELEGLEKRKQTALGLAAGTIPSAVIESRTGNVGAPSAPVDLHDTPEYRNAFMEYVCRGTQIPMELRADQSTTTTDASAVIPTTLMNEIIKETKVYGDIYRKVRKLNVQGGVEFPILTLKPTAKWVGEGKSDDQKVKADDHVSFSYHGLECKISQSLLASVVTYDAFQREFAPLAAEAIVEGLEKGIFSGTGTGQMLGILKDSRVPAANTITINPTEFASWAGWKKKVFAKMKKAYRKGEFVMAQGTFDGYIDGMVDTTGQPIGRVNYGIEGSEKYRFGGKEVNTVEEDVLPNYDDAADGDVVAVFFNPNDYAINSNMQMTMVKWVDHDDNKVKNKGTIICDGKLIDANGVILIKKGAAPAGS